MKVGIVGVGAVGTACAKAMLLRGSCREIVLLDRDEARARGVAADLSHGGVLCPPCEVTAGGYAELAGASAVVVTAGINERAGGATDRSDPQGRLLLLEPNARTYREVVPQVARAAPEAPIVVVTDPPDPLADVARELTDTNPVLSAGTFLDSLRFRLQIARCLGRLGAVDCRAADVEAMVVGEHGISQVYVWSSARVAGVPVLDLVARSPSGDPARFRAEVEEAVRFANISIIEGTGASQHGIGVVTARIVEAILRDEGLIAPVGVVQPAYGVTLSLPSVIGRSGVSKVLSPPLSADESAALDRSARTLRQALEELRAASR
jgi:L-lactate dehydrogenase